MTSIAPLLLLPLSLLALYQSTTTTEARQVQRSQEEANGSEKLLRWRRSLDEAIKAPPSSSRFTSDWYRLRRNRAQDILRKLKDERDREREEEQAQAIGQLPKRDDEWIWMPAHGYIPMPKDQSDNAGGERDNGIGNLLRYG